MPPPTFKVGDHVGVPWGLDTVEGIVVDTYRTGAVDRIVVEVQSRGISNEGERFTVVLPADALTKLTEVKPSGSWLHALRYEREAADAIARIIHEWEPGAAIIVADPATEADVRADTQSGTLIVDIKLTDKISERDLRHIRTLVERAGSRNVRGLLVTAGALTEKLFHIVRRNGLASPNVGVARWRGPEDDARLRSVVRTLLDLTDA